ncbi:MAG: hypothetical protein NC302_01075 [Bacteroidales bacterium]|nr:hypothetical protein [Bacteroidales bacterium]MCM1416995.1 hypothetical protein [bacterium]MCM1424804.1 hypothetical protein [bacterium]
MEKKVTPEKRMELARYIREENMGNRFKLRQREHILYGREDMPLYDKASFSESQDAYGTFSGAGDAPRDAAGGFKVRMTLAVLLFVGFLLCDTNQGKILSYDTDQIYEMILSDSLHLSEGGNAVLEEVAALLD